MFSIIYEYMKQHVNRIRKKNREGDTVIITESWDINLHVNTSIKLLKLYKPDERNDHEIS